MCSSDLGDVRLAPVIVRDQRVARAVDRLHLLVDGDRAREVAVAVRVVVDASDEPRIDACVDERCDVALGLLLGVVVIATGQVQAACAEDDGGCDADDAELAQMQAELESAKLDSQN